jgi:8-oxo-dGTP diphosphatase
MSGASEQERRERAASAVPPHMPPPHERDPGDAWVYAPDGVTKFWGRFGAAGLLVWHRESGVLLQHRAEWSHNGGTWALPGGARREHESALEGALREADEEAGVPPELVVPLFESVVDLGFWSYTTVAVEATSFFEPVVADFESLELRWVPLDQVDALPLHPAFAEAWPGLRARLV